MSSAIQPATSFQPAACHVSNGPHVPTEAPADREVDVARVVGDALEVVRGVVEHVAERRPQELRLRMGARAKPAELLAGVAHLEDLRNLGRDFARGQAVVGLRGIEHLDLAALLAVEARAGLLAERALGDQRRHHLRHVEVRVPGIVLERVAHRADHVRGRVQTDDVHGAEGRALRTADRRAGQRVDDVVTQAGTFGVHHRRDDRKHADAVGDEVRRVLGAHHALAERGHHEPLELVEQPRLGVRAGDQLEQMHVARRIEEVHAAEARADRRGQHLRQRRERQPRGVGREDRVGCEVRHDLRVEIALPVEAFGDRLDHQVALGEPGKAGRVVGDSDVRCAVLDAERRGLELGETGDALLHDAVGIALLRGEVEEDHRDIDVDELGGDLRTHDAGTEHGDLANDHWRCGHVGDTG